MPQVSVQGQATDHMQGFIKIGIENQLRIVSFGIAKTKRKLELFEKEAGILPSFAACVSGVIVAQPTIKYINRNGDKIKSLNIVCSYCLHRVYFQSSLLSGICIHQI